MSNQRADRAAAAARSALAAQQLFELEEQIEALETQVRLLKTEAAIWRGLAGGPGVAGAETEIVIPTVPVGGPSGGRPKLSGKRQQLVFATLIRHPNMTAVELATAVRVKPNYMYRMLPELERAGHISRDTKGNTTTWRLTQLAEAAAADAAPLP